MTIVEFLTARLDEAEAKLQRVDSQMDRPHWPGCNFPGDLPGWCDCDLTEWLLADIAAKRALLTEPTDRCDSDYTCHGWERWEWTLRLLATSLYANHPDYSPEWRP